MSSGQPARLILVRHGETAANREFRYIGSRDDPLSQHGEAQARAVAQALERLPIAAIFCSPRRRAHATAQPLADALSMHIDIREELAEGGFGTWEGLSRSEVLARGPEDAALLRMWETDDNVAPGGHGESLASMQRRVTNFADTIAGAHPGSMCVLISHVGPIKGLITATLGVPPGTARALFLDPATISVVDRGSRQVLRLFNSHAHLGWENARWME